MRKGQTARRLLCAALTACLLPALSGCGRQDGEEGAPSPTLAPARISAKAPDGDRAVREARDYIIYLPGENELKLMTRSVRLEESNLMDTVGTLVRLLLESADTASGRTLSLYHGQAPEISGGICTVNLDSSALQLSYSDYYRLSVAIATTLCALDEINGVNVLTAGQSVALDISGNLAMGVISAHPEENLTALWEQMEAKRAPLGSNAARMPLNATATVYYPLTDGRGISCESRMMSFEGQTPNQMAEALIREADALFRGKSGEKNLPELTGYLLHMPVASELEDGGKLITISFSEDIQDMLDRWHTDLPCLIAASVCTLTTFIPGVTAVCVRIGDKPITEISNGRFAAGTILGGLVRRETAEIFLTGSAQVFFEKDGRLTPCAKPVERNMTDSPRALLETLLEGPDERERQGGFRRTVPETVRGEDILGIAAEGDMLLVNLSGGFREAIRAFGPEREAALCYSMVNTLCLNSGMKRVCFFFEGEQAETIAGELYWGGEFMYNPGL